MAANTSPIFEKTSAPTGLQFTSADTNTKKTLATGGADGTRIDSISLCSNDTAAIVLNFYLNIGGTDFYIGCVTVAIGAGYTTVLRQDAIPTIAPLLGYLWLGSGHILKCACNATMTAAKTLDVVALGGTY